MEPTTIPVLPSRDLASTAAFYAPLGFEEVARYPDEYLVLRHSEGIELHFFLDASLDPLRNHAGCYIRYSSAAAAGTLHAVWDGAVPEPGMLRPPEVTDYGLLEFALLDLDRNLVRVGGLLTELDTG